MRMRMRRGRRADMDILERGSPTVRGLAYLVVMEQFSLQEF
jgi:hypothetical protein